MMKRSLILLLIFVSFLQPSFAQQYKEGIVNRRFDLFQIGDTVKVVGVKTNDITGRIQYAIKVPYQTVLVNMDRVDLLPDDFSYWDNLWFDNRAIDVADKGWESKNRELLSIEAMEYADEIKQNNLLFEDELLYDYLYQLIFKIHPNYLIKDKNRVFHIIIIKSTEPTYFSFENGMIVLTTGAIASANTEQELVNMLAESVANIVLDHNLINLNHAIRAENRAKTWGNIAAFASAAVMAYNGERNGVYYSFDDALNIGLAASYLTYENLQRIGANYNQKQLELTRQASQIFWENNSHYFTKDRSQFIALTSNAVSYTAWQEFHSKNYEYALKLAEKLESMGMAMAEEYLLLSKLYRKLGNDLDSNLQALEYIKNAKSMDDGRIIDLDLEEGLIYFRMEDYNNASKAFHQYKEQLLSLDDSDQRVKTDLKFINQLLHRFQMNDESTIGLTKD
ncbi:hypothetical protein [Belliella pelovolcani]|uniref:hypothetical protein n=1 Tax=Belliella pelovolcani TaxID=529505 RepID=UPI00391C69D2